MSGKFKCLILHEEYSGEISGIEVQDIILGFEIMDKLELISENTSSN